MLLVAKEVAELVEGALEGLHEPEKFLAALGQVAQNKFNKIDQTLVEAVERIARYRVELATIGEGFQSVQDVLRGIQATLDSVEESERRIAHHRDRLERARTTEEQPVLRTIPSSRSAG